MTTYSVIIGSPPGGSILPSGTFGSLRWLTKASTPAERLNIAFKFGNSGRTSKSGCMKARYSISATFPRSGQMRISRSGSCSANVSRHAFALPIRLSRSTMSSAIPPHEPDNVSLNCFRSAYSLRARVRRRRSLRRPICPLGALRNHLAHDALRIHLHTDPRRCRGAGDRDDHLATRREIVQCALGRLGVGPYGGVGELFERRHVEALAALKQLPDRVPRRQIEQQAFRRRLVGGEVPDSPIAVSAGNVPALRPFWRRE